MNEWHIQKWISDSDINQIEYSEYWNDEEEEKKKEWYVLDGNFLKMEQYLRKTGLPQDLTLSAKILRTDFNRQLSGIGIDLAAGNLWAVDKLYCLEYSQHRLLKVGPAVLDHYGVPKEKIVLVLGSFYDLHIDDNSLDFVFMSQAFHHADKPHRLLEEIRRVLKPHGVVIIIGEHCDYRKAQIKHAIKFLISVLVPERLQERIFKRIFRVRTLVASSNEIFRPDSILGDHYYTDSEYRSMFSKHGFQVNYPPASWGVSCGDFMKHLRNHNSQFQSFVLVRNVS